MTPRCLPVLVDSPMRRCILDRMRILPLSVALALVILSSAGASTQNALSAPEQRVVQQVDGSIRAAETLLERVVNINSGTMNLAGVRRVGDVFKAEFDAL